MTDRLTIALAQLNQRVGDLDGNVAAMLEWRGKARGADLIVVPELQLTGYPPEDLVLKREFVRRAMEASERLIDSTADGGPALLFGSLHHEEGRDYNAVLLADGGKLVARRSRLPRPAPPRRPGWPGAAACAAASERGCAAGRAGCRVRPRRTSGRRAPPTSRPSRQG